MWFCCM
jgi:hypothetical protein